MKDVVVIASLNVAHIINEPIAAAIPYGLDKKGREKNIVIFFYLGSGMFDVSVLIIDNIVFEVLATNDDTHLGGEDFNQRIMKYFIKLIKKKHEKDISKDNRALGKLRREVEHAKRALSSQHQVQVEIESLFNSIDFSELLTRAHFIDTVNENAKEIFEYSHVPGQAMLHVGFMIKKFSSVNSFLATTFLCESLLNGLCYILFVCVYISKDA